MLETSKILTVSSDAAVGASVLAGHPRRRGLATPPETQRRAHDEIDTIFGRDNPLP